MKFKFEKLIIWQKAMDFGEDINILSNKFSKKEIYNLSSQILRSADSIALNISEGSIGQSNAEYKTLWGMLFVHWQKLLLVCIKLKDESISLTKNSINSMRIHLI